MDSQWRDASRIEVKFFLKAALEADRMIVLRLPDRATSSAPRFTSLNEVRRQVWLL